MPENKLQLEGRNILLCVCGGIACYKSADLASKFVQAGAGVSVIMTESACEFIQPLTFQALTKKPVYTSMWVKSEDLSLQHISLTQQADIMVVAPATANIIGKFAHGIADDLVSTSFLAAEESCKILLAPAMNERMWRADAVKENCAKLKGWGVEFVGPDEGFLACGTTGPGRMSQPQDIFDKTVQLLD